MTEKALIFTVVSLLIPFCIFASLALLIRGRESLNWSKGMKQSALTNVSLGALNLLVAPFVFVLNEGFRSGYEALSLPHVPTEFWEPTPLVILCLVAIIVYDFADYWSHRLLHTRAFWPIHAVHHSDPDMNHTTSMRIHILEAVVMNVFYIAMLSWLGLPGEGAVILYLVHLLYNRFVHVALDIHFGPLSKVLATPRFHQWHHAVEPAAHNKNFANIFSLWDVIFKTYRVPGPMTGAMGFEGSPDHNLPKLFFWPVLDYGRQLKAAFSRKVTADS